ncbi:UDP-3-O-acylglucosamine N-acyltransferase [Gossypium arboreum]|uniref:UDP-3-O-acylglucosamine N-acyltransferase n=1 Tax=Gossypium arboreum TaxID=29729 RepID=A0A0B0PTS0_GOSAR|nr:UDP-3-O-acylglucosamine N-acyltransferase [Gossypium arboreum]
MAVTLKRLSSIPPFIFRNFPLSTPSRFGSLYNFFVSSTNRTALPNSVVNSETGADVDDGQEFLKWKNGGGHFHQSACIDPTVVIEIGAIVYPKSVLGANVHVGSGTAIGPCVKIGQFTKIGYNAALSNCSVGDSCVIHNGVCIGQDGFGFFVDEDGNMVKKPQIGHNVVIGKSCMLCGQVGIAGSVIIGDYVVLGGRVAVRDHVSIISKVRLAANSCVTKDIREPGDYGGFPAVPIHVWRRQIAIQCRSSKKGKS